MGFLPMIASGDHPMPATARAMDDAAMKKSKLERSAPKPHHAYERADPEAEAGMGDLDKDQHTPVDREDSHQNAAMTRPDGKPLKSDCDENLGRPASNARR